MDNADAIEKNYKDMFPGMFDNPVQRWPASPGIQSAPACNLTIVRAVRSITWYGNFHQTDSISERSLRATRFRGGNDDDTRHGEEK